jgi:hypothetical protein
MRHNNTKTESGHPTSGIPSSCLRTSTPRIPVPSGVSGTQSLSRTTEFSSYRQVDHYDPGFGDVMPI